MFAGRAALSALVHVLRAVNAFESRGTGAHVGAVDGRSVANGARVTRVRRTRVIQVTQEPRLPGRTLAVEGADAVVAGGAVEAGRRRAVVDIVGARDSCPAIDANAGKGSQSVDARGAVLTHVRSYGALVHVARTVGSCPLRRTLTRVGVEAVLASGAVLTQIAAAVVDIVFAVLAREAHRTLTRVAQRLVVRHTVAAVETPVVLTGNVALVAVLAREAAVAVALEAAHCVQTNASPRTDVRTLRALVHVLRAVVATEARNAFADIRRLSRMTLCAVPTLIADAVVSLGTGHSRPALSAVTLEVLQRVLELTLAVVETRVGVAD